MRAFTLAFLSLVSAAVAQNCGPDFSNKVCDAGKCCSQYGWCDDTPNHCDPATCQSEFSGPGSSCADDGNDGGDGGNDAPSDEVPEIDVCGSAQGGVSCPGAGINGYFYRCCSSAGHCGPKNDIQDQNLFCGTGCQAGFGKCDNEAKPPQPEGEPGTSGAGETCGPIVNKKCAQGLCCSGSNFCGTGEDFCGSANWCQSKWGQCS